MKYAITTFSVLAFVAAAIVTAEAGDKGNSVKHDGVMTEKLGKEVPTMTNDAEPAEDSKASDAATYTDKVGEAVPKMTAPDASQEDAPK